jgi:hypothetical protein
VREGEPELGGVVGRRDLGADAVVEGDSVVVGAGRLGGVAERQLAGGAISGRRRGER